MVFYKVYVTINNNHVKSKIVKTKPFGFMKIFEINTFFTMCIKLDTLLLGDVNENHTTIHPKMVQFQGFAKKTLIWVDTIINTGWIMICEIIDKVQNF